MESAVPDEIFVSCTGVRRRHQLNTAPQVLPLAPAIPDRAPLKLLGPASRRVAWTIDGEPGTVVALNDSAMAVRWQESGIEWYSFGSGAIERIQPFTQRSTCRFKR